jgi:Prohead core protein serine protease
MAKLLRETIFDVKPDILEEGTSASKTYYLKGIHMQTETVNKNNRVYPREIMEREIQRYMEECVKPKRASAMGELGHPDNPTINLPLASHIIENLYFKGNDIYGVSKILDTPNGRIAKSLIDEGIVLGMSSRALGSVKEQNGHNVVQEDVRLSTVDIVAEPSAHQALVDGIREGKEWIMVNGIWTEQHMENVQKSFKTTLRAEDVDKVALLMFSRILNNVKL